jgi:protoporphyrinogen IX oxidase
MTGFLGSAYPWIKALHIIFVMFWMAGLFMLPRFYAYHQEAPAGSEEANRWIAREQRLVRIILNPAMVVVWALGLALVVNLGVARDLWFIVKFVGVAVLSVYHFWMVGYARRFENGASLVSNRTMRLLNEVPGLISILAVIMVIVRPY